MAGDFIGLTDKQQGDNVIDGIGGRTTKPIGETSIFHNESLDGVPRQEDLFAVRFLGQTAQIEKLKDIIKSQIASTEFSIVPDVPESEDREPTDAELQAAENAEKFFRGNYNDNNTSIDALHGQLLDDVLDMNSGVLELVPDEQGNLKKMIPRDGLTFTINEDKTGELPKPDSDKPAYYQFSLASRAKQFFRSDRQGIDINELREEMGGLNFTQIFNREQKKFSRDQIVWFSEPQNAKTHTPYGRGRTQKVKTLAENMINGDNHRNRFFLDNEYHKGFLQVDEGTSQKQVKQIRQRFAGNAGDEFEMQVIGGDNLDWVSIDPEPEKMQFLESQKWYTKEVLRAYGLNDVEGGMLENSNKGISDNAKQQIFRRVTGPILDMFEKRWNNQVLPFMAEFKAVDVPLKFQYEPENRFMESLENDIISEELENATMTVNEARQRKNEQGFGELGNVPKSVLEEYARENPSFVIEELTDLEDVPSGDGGGGGLFQAVEADAEEINTDSKQLPQEKSQKKSIEDIDLTPPDSVVSAAEEALKAKEKFSDEIGDCGTGVGESRARSIINNTLSPEDFLGGEKTAIPDYLDSHSEDVEGITDHPSDWEKETWTDGCGPVQYALWGGTATGTGLEWANETEEQLREAREDEDKSGSGSGSTTSTEIDSYREAFKHKDEILKQTKDALRNERGFKDVPGIVEHKNKMAEAVAEVFNSIDLQAEIEQNFPEESQENGVLVNADKIVEDIDFRDRLASVLESNNITALEMSAEHNEQDIEEETEERLTIPSETKVELNFDVTDTLTADLIREQAFDSATTIEDTVKDRLKNELLDGANKGEGIPDITDRIQDTVDNISKDHAELVARTETLSSSRKGSQALAESTDLVGGKEWLATNDSRTREWHDTMDGTVIPKDEQFTVPRTGSDKQPSDYPRTARVVGEDQPFNCRCSQAPVLAEDMPDSPQQLEADFDGVSIDLGVTKRQFEVWKEHGQEFDSFEQFWSDIKQNKSVSGISDKFGMSRTTVYDWNKEISEVKNPEGVPEDAYPVESADDCDGSTTQGPRGGLYCIPEDSEDEDDDDQNLDQPPEEVFEEFGSEEQRENVTDNINSWTGWPTDESTASMWQAANEVTGNDNDPTDAFGDRSMLEHDADPEKVEDLKEFQEFTEEKLREEHGDNVEVHRFFHSDAADKLKNGESLSPRTIGSWTSDTDKIEDLLNEVPKPDGDFADPEEAVVVTKEIPVEKVLAHHATNPELDNQKEVVAMLDEDDDLQDGDVRTVAEVIEENE